MSFNSAMQPPVERDWGFEDDLRAIVESHVPTAADAIQAVMRGTTGVIDVAGPDTKREWLEQRYRRLPRRERNRLINRLLYSRR